MNISFHHIPLVLSCAFLIACGDPRDDLDATVERDAATSTVDAGRDAATSDAGSNDAGPRDATTNDSAVSDGGPRDAGGEPRDAGDAGDAGGEPRDAGGEPRDAGDVVSRCEASALDMSTRCGGGSDRQCEWLAIRDLCANERADVLLADMACTRMFSPDPGGVGCRTFSDPSGAEDCIVAAHGAFDITAARETSDRTSAASAALCDTPSTSPLHSSAVPFAALSSDTLAEIDLCVSTASTCDALHTCVRGVFATIFACY